MGRFWISSLIIMTLVLANWWFCHGCWEVERFALLQLKSNINYPKGKYLPSWIDDNKSDCCEWPNVVCDTTTKRVVQISLNSKRAWTVQGDWHFNASLFLPIKMLRSLSLAENSLAGWVESQGFEKLSVLSRLENLNLEGNGFTDRSVLSSLSHLRSLKSLMLGDGLFDDSSHGRLTNLKKLEFLALNFTFTRVSNFQSVCRITDFTNLKELDISGNNFQSLGPIHGLPKLEILHLTNNNFSNTIFSSLKQLPSLKFVDLSRNYFMKGSIQINELLALKELDLSETGVDKFVTTKGIANVSHLEVLHLDDLDERGTATSNLTNLLQSLTIFPSLKTLYFQKNGNFSVETHYLEKLSKLENLILDITYILDKNFLTNIGGLMSFKVISLSECGLGGTLPNQGWCELTNLQELRLSRNEFNGVLPPCLGNLTSLRLIDLSSNQFSGNVAISALSRLTSLESLAISDNHFQIPISFESFSNHSNLKFIFAKDNEVILETSFRNTVPSFQLEFFSLSNCVGHPRLLPSFLLHQNQLRIIDLSHNNVGGDFPIWLLENNTKLEGFYMGGNDFKGDLKFPQKPNSYIDTFDISENNLGGQIPNDINVAFPNIIVLNMSWNNLVGDLPSSFGDLESLRWLDLSNNNLTGKLPHELAAGCLSLKYLRLSNNKFHGQIFPEGLNTYELWYLYLDNNNFEGMIPDSLSILYDSLQALDLSNNLLKGELPKWISKMTQLVHLSMSNNQLEGPIPMEFCKLDMIQLLDISGNSLSGSIPSCFNPSLLRHLHLSKNRFGGLLTHAFYNSSSLVTLDLSENNFRGRIPEWIGSLKELSILLLKGNNFEGIIPIQFCQLSKLSILDLSYNNLSGSIPHCLGEMTIAKENGERKSNTASVVGNPKTQSITWYILFGKLATAFHLPLAIVDDFDYFVDDHIRAEFTTKLQGYSFKGLVLEYMSGIDLSCNQLIGSIPINLGNLSNIRALNLSHNNLTGVVPITLSGLVNIESLDLSYNMLNGRIPAQLLQLNFLEVFSVAYNNLSGPTPERKAQFATFEEISYEGNALLCGPPLSNLCTKNEPPPQVLLPEDNKKEEDSFMDLESFYISFGIAYTTMVLTWVAVLCINPYWRRLWFNFIEFYAMSCYYFVLDRIS